MKKAGALLVLMVMVLVLVPLTACGPTKLPGGVTINATGDNVDVYRSGFGEHFDDVTAFDVSALNGSGFNVHGTRYHVAVADYDAVLTSKETIDNGFFIGIRDDGDTVKIHIVYTTGSESENATIANSAILSGKVTVEKDLSFVPNEKDDKTLRAEQIASALYNTLKEIEG